MFDSILRSAVRAVFMVALVFVLAARAAASAPTYALLDTQHIPGPTHWDCLTFDPHTQRLFIAHGDKVDVLDAATQKLVGTVADTKGVHSVAVMPDMGRGYATDGVMDMVTVFDLATLKTLTTVRTGDKPDAIVYDPKTERAFIANGNSNDITVLDANNDGLVDTIKLSGKPEFAVIDGQGKLYINIENKSQLSVIDTEKTEILATYDLAPACENPTGLAIDTAQRRLFVTCGNKKMVVVQAETGKIVAALPIGAHSDGAAFDPATGLAFSSNGEGTVTVIGSSASGSYKVLQTITTTPLARTMALDPSTHRLYLAAAESEGFDPPDEKHPEPRPHLKPDTFMILTVGPKP